MPVTRRNFLKASIGIGITSSISGCIAHSLPIQGNTFPSLENQPIPSALGLATSLPHEYHYETKIEGKVPSDLRGVLYRNGPGLFERNGLRKRFLLDGDGMIQAFRFHDKGVSFQNKFVRTQKYTEESIAKKFLYSTWTTQSPGGVMSNLFGYNMMNQAGVNVIRRGNTLYANDESSQPYALNPDTLDTIGLDNLGQSQEYPIVYSAHWKVDGKNGDWIHFGSDYGKNLNFHLTIFDQLGKLKKHWILPSPRYVYIHDFFVTESYIILNLQPSFMSVYGFLFGQESIVDSISWQPEQGNLIMVVDKSGEQKPFYLPIEASWMWHSLNAYEKGNDIIAEFVAASESKELIGLHPMFKEIMSAEKGDECAPYHIRRYIIDIKKKVIKQEILNNGDLEFPSVNPNHSCHPHKFGYLVKKTNNELFWENIVRINMDSGNEDVYHFGVGYYCSEPIFVPKRNTIYDFSQEREPGYLLTEVYNGYTQKTFLAIFDAEHIDDGPIAQVHLHHHVPISFHGSWYQT